MEKNYQFAANDFAFAQKDAKLTDLKFDTKPIGYFKDAWIRFRKSKAAIFGGVVIILIVMYALIMPFCGSNDGSVTDGVYQKMVAYNEPLASSLHICDGTYDKALKSKGYLALESIAIGYEDNDGAHLADAVAKCEESPYNPIVSVKSTYMSEGAEVRDCKVQAYWECGFRFYQIDEAEYNNMVAWQEETGKQLLFPMLDKSKIETIVLTTTPDKGANYWYQTKGGYPVRQDGSRISTIEGMKNAVDVYLRDDAGNILYRNDVATKGSYEVRVFYWHYYQYKHAGKLPNFLFGTDDQGRDIAVRLASGIRLSLILSISTFVVNFVIGAIYGSIEGYYGGAADLIMERISDILANIPFVVLASIVNMRYISTGKMNALGALIFAFVLTGWLGPAYRVRTQFYRFKNQEYVLAARTLGANDARIMFKHIFPNTLGTIITASVLTIPGTIFSESSLSYLGIINLEQGTTTSLGTMLATGQQFMTTYPHIIFPPAIIISLLMISFNLFGNGLRDAFNPSLRGVEE